MSDSFLRAIHVQEFYTPAQMREAEAETQAACINYAKALQQRDRYRRYFVWSFGFIMAEVAFATAYWIVPAIINWFIARWF